MDPAAAASLKALSLTTIGRGLRVIAETWAKLCIDHLPTGGKTLTSLQADYRELLGSLPISEPEEIEPLLRQYARAMRLKGDRVTASQQHFFAQIVTRKELQRLAHSDPLVMAASDTFDYVEEIPDRAGLSDLRLSKAMAIYAISHAMLGVEFPTITDEFRKSLCTRLANGLLYSSDHLLTLDLMISEHSRWIAQIIRDHKATAYDAPVEIEVAEYEKAEVAGYQMDDELEEAETAMAVKQRRQRYH
jgi:hypothetical protein